ncbi:MAG: PAS domain S-box protein [Chloroflexi bacterium]|nr:PAS domain S-box protein [Chloroflexota bacterium]
MVGFRIRATGEERWAYVSATALTDDKGALEYVINAFHDITDRKRAELERDAERERLAGILDQRLADEARLAELIRSEQARAAELDAIIGAIGEGIVVADRDGSIRLANRTALDMLAPSDPPPNLETLLGRFDFVPPRSDDPASLAGGLPGGTLLARLNRGDGSSRWIEISAYPVGARDAEPTEEMILVLRDVSAAREREQARDAFIGMLSHELRTPITTIYAGAKVLARHVGLPHDTRLEIFEDVHGEAERLHRLVEDVVALTRLGEGALEIGSEPVLLQRFLPLVVRSEEGRWPDAAFELAIPEDLPPVAGDATYVEQVVRNLLANAVKYAGAGSHVTIAARWQNGEVAVRVLDDGPGFPEADAERLFDLYYRASSTAQKVSGSGIGLFVCSRLIAAMGGRMWAANRPGGGAEFGFALRVVDEDAQDAEVPEAG